MGIGSNPHEDNKVYKILVKIKIIKFKIKYIK